MDQGDISPVRSEFSSSTGTSPSIPKTNKNRRRRRKPKANSTGTTTTMMISQSPPSTASTTGFDDFFFSSSPKKSTHAANISPHPDNSNNNNTHNKHRNYNHTNSNSSGNSNSNSNSHSNSHHKKPSHHHQPADMTVIVNRVDLWDAASKFITPDEQQLHNALHAHAVHCAVAPYHFAPDVSCWLSSSSSSSCSPRHRTTTTTTQFHHSSPAQQQQQPQQHLTVAVIRVPYAVKFQLADPNNHNCNHNCTEHDDNHDIDQHHQDSGDLDHSIDHHVIDTSTPNPHGSIVDKYWAQRRRLFSRFDLGIELDEEGWYSVTPEIIADHVARRVGESSNSAAFSRGLPGSRINETKGIVVLDAFCGCGGNSIAFGKIPKHLISLVICVDVDRTKLRKAAHNASLYDIPKDKLVFVECNTMFILQYCFKNGDFVLDQPSALGSVMPSLPSPVQTEVYAGFTIGGLNVLPRHIDAVFMDPPWGGVDYEVLGKNGYDLFLNMKISIEPGMHSGSSHKQILTPSQHTSSSTPAPPTPPPEVEPTGTGGGISDDFFDSFGGGHGSNKSNKQQFQNDHHDDVMENLAAKSFVNGAELLQLAAAATASRLVIYDLPRNTNKNSLGQAALDSGYRGNIKLEEHWLNGRLKTVTAYFGADYSNLLQQHRHHHHHHHHHDPRPQESASFG